MAGEPNEGRVDPDRAAERARDERLVLAVRAGDPNAFGGLYDQWYDRVHDLARRITRDGGLAADVAQDAFLAAWQRLDGLDDPASFGGWLLRIARNRALDVVRAPARTRTDAVADMTDAVATGPEAGDRLAGLADPADVAADHEVQQLVWEAAGALGERDLTALDLHLRHGLEPAEIGEVLGINRNAANQLVHRMRGRLSTAVACRVLWQGGRPPCRALRADLSASGLDALEVFDAETVRVTDRHAASCQDCTRRRALRLDPAKLFAAMPIAVAGLALKQKAAAALSAQGVPMDGSAALHADPSTASDAPDPLDPSGDGEANSTAPRRWARAGAFTAAALVVLVLALVLGVEALGDGLRRHADTEAAAPLEAVPHRPATTEPEGGMTLTTTAQQPTADPVDGGDPDVTGTPDGVDDPAPDTPTVVTAPPPPPPAAPAGSINAAPSRVSTVHPNGQAVISWSSAGGTSVSVSGPGLSSSSPSGSQSVCPGTVVSSVCRAPAGSYTYVLTVTGPGGSVERSATLTVA